MSLTESRVQDSITLRDGRSLALREARWEDIDGIKNLYYAVYGGRYTLPEVTDRDKMEWAINDPNYIWLLVEDQDRLVASVIFVVDPQMGLGKTFAGVVDPAYRGHGLLVTAQKRGLAHLLEGEGALCDAIYAVVRTFTPRSFHKDLQSVGFVDLGVFPNVRKVKKYETHGLKVKYSTRALENRRRTPRLILPAQNIYAVAQQLLALEDARVEAIQLPQRPGDGRWSFMIEKSREVEYEYYRVRDEGHLKFDFFPLHYPQLKLYTRDQKDVVFIHFLETDGHACILGIRTEEEDLSAFLVSVGEMAESIGIKYLELLVSAYDPLLQQCAYEANFLPCAYFPAMKRDPSGVRMDYVVCSSTFVPPHFRGLTLTAESRPYVQAYYKVYTARLWEEIQET